MSDKRTFTVEQPRVGLRLDVALAGFFGISRSFAQTVIAQGLVFVNGKKAPKNHKLNLGDNVEASLPPQSELRATPQALEISVLYEDEYLLVVDKPKGMVVHPSAGNKDGTLVNALLYHCKGRLSTINGVIRPGIVHRLDKDTSGLLVVAKTDESHFKLARQIALHSFTRRYEAVCDGGFSRDSGEIDLPIGRSVKDRKKMAVTSKSSKAALTRYRVITKYNGYTHFELTLETGRTHQIRVHLSHQGHPITGDTVYGRGKNPFGLKGQCLFAKYIEFIHPITGKTLAFEGEYPEYFLKTLSLLESAYKV